MKKMARNFISYLPIFDRLKIAPGFDCGMPMCIFNEKQLGILYKVCNRNLQFGCGPAVDIGPDMMVWSCFPLSDFNKKSLYDFNSIQDIVKFYQKLHNKIRIEIGGIFEECDDCQYRDKELCLGGCIAHIINGFKNEAAVRPKEVYL